jgi:hypothetical protein
MSFLEYHRGNGSAERKKEKSRSAIEQSAHFIKLAKNSLL